MTASLATSRLALACAAALVLAGATTSARTTELSEQDRIVAAFVFNFCKVVTWPAAADSLTLMVVGDDGAAGALQELDGRTVGRGRLRVLAEPADSSFAGCNLLYLSPDAGDDLEAILARVATMPVLTVSTADDFCERGGMVQLVSNRGKIRLHINNRRAVEANLVMSSQLLKMATIVEE